MLLLPDSLLLLSDSLLLLSDSLPLLPDSRLLLPDSYPMLPASCLPSDLPSVSLLLSDNRLPVEHPWIGPGSHLYESQRTFLFRDAP